MNKQTNEEMTEPSKKEISTSTIVYVKVHQDYVTHHRCNS